jgi:hypothetical protein
VVPRLPKAKIGRAVVWLVGVVTYFQLTAITWLLFRADTIKGAWVMFRSLWRGPWHDISKQLADLGPAPLAATLVLLLLAGQVVPYFRGDNWAYWKLPSPLRALVYASGAVLFALLGRDGAEAFIYFQF